MSSVTLHQISTNKRRAMRSRSQAGRVELCECRQLLGAEAHQLHSGRATTRKTATKPKAKKVLKLLRSADLDSFRSPPSPELAPKEGHEGKKRLKKQLNPVNSSGLYSQSSITAPKPLRDLEQSQQNSRQSDRGYSANRGRTAVGDGGRYGIKSQIYNCEQQQLHRRTPHILGYTARPGPPDLTTFRSSSLQV
ncbi:hypothetical protein SRHO_G00076320 [Serrasalmus rhombeus]